MIFSFFKKKNVIEEQMDDMQLSTSDEIYKSIRELDLALATVEINGCKPEVVYRHIMQARFRLKNLALDLKTDARI